MAHKQTTRIKSKLWFKPVRGSYLPASPQGLGVYGLYVAYIVAVAVVWYRQGHGAWPLLVNVFPAWAIAAFITQAVAAKTSR